MALFTVLLTEARPGLTGAPDVSILSALRRAAAHFCRQTGIWSDVLSPIKLRAGVYVYDFDAPLGGNVENILSLKINGVAITNHMRFQDMHALTRDAAGGLPTAFSITSDGGSLAVWPTPRTEDAGLVVDVLASLSPARTSPELPDFMTNEWHDAIVAGAKADLMLIPEMPWSNPGAAMNCRAYFEEQVSRARKEAYSGHHAPLRVRQRPFA